MKPKNAAIEIWDVDGSGVRYAIALDGIVRYVGPREQCVFRAKILAHRSDRELQDLMLTRALTQAGAIGARAGSAIVEHLGAAGGGESVELQRLCPDREC